MSLYKKPGLIPGHKPLAESPARDEHRGDLPSGPDRNPDRGPTRAAIRAGDAPVRSGAASDSGQAPGDDRAAVLWTNDRWAVTEAGLESRYVINGRPIPAFVERERLLRVRPGTAGVAGMALHLAEKSWVHSPEPLLDAYAEALRRHHPGQSVVDMDATAEAVRWAWARVGRGAGGYDRDWDYAPGEATLRAAAERGAPIAPPPADHEPEDPWVTAAVARIREVLARHGVDPAAHSGGLHVNERLAAMALAGSATEHELADAADRLKHEHVARAEEPEDEPPPALDEVVEGDIEDAIAERHRLRREIS